MTAAEMTFDFRGGGRSLKNAQTVGPGKLVLVPQDPSPVRTPALQAQGAQTITAGQFVMAFDDRSRLKTLSGLSGTRSVLEPPAAAPPGVGQRETSSERLEATFDPPTGALVAALQSGNFQFSEGERKASAEQAEYSSPTQVLTLTGHPKVWDTVTRVNAERVLMHLDTDTAEGIGKVQSTHFGAETASRPVQAGAGLKPGATSGGATPNAGTGTANVLADRMLATRPGQLAHYEGHVRAWQGADVVEAASLDYNGKERRLSSGSGVVTSHLAPASDIPGSSTPSGPASSRPGAVVSRKKERSHPLTVRADHLDFFDQGHKASYRGNVELETESTTLRADRMDVYFQAEGAPGGSEVERAVADGRVRVTQPGRRATGDHLEYEAAAGRIVMRGGSPALYDEARGFTTGQRLTFFTHDDRLLVDGGEKSRALSEYRMPQ
jgi:lipopolysaccharide transport protein LptA